MEIFDALALSQGEIAGGLRALQETAGKRFLRGVLLYLGDEVVPFGPNLVAVPIEALWN